MTAQTVKVSNRTVLYPTSTEALRVYKALSGTPVTTADDPDWCLSTSPVSGLRCWLDMGHGEFHRNFTGDVRWP